MPNYVCNGASMNCSFGDSSATLTVLPDKRILEENQPAANIMDFKPMVNIPPFGKCMSLINPLVAAATVKNQGVLDPQPCIPVIVSPWMPGKPDVLLANQPALIDYCLNTCVYMGIITISDAGQTSISSDMAGADMGAFLADFSAAAEKAAADAAEAIEEELNPDPEKEKEKEKNKDK